MKTIPAKHQSPNAAAPRCALIRLRLLIVLAAFALIPAFNLRAGNPSTDFESGNRLYEQGKYSDAIAAYDKLLQSGAASEPLYFNRGNAWFKLGQIGRAIASYREASRLAPRDPDLRANLQSARTRARGGSPYHGDRLYEFIDNLTLNEWTLFTAASIWLFFILLALSQWRIELKTPLRKYFIAACVLVLASGTCLGIALTGNYFTEPAIVINGEADVRNGPLEESQTLYRVRDGIELEIVDRKDDWLQVMDSARRVGWLRRDQVLIFTPYSPSGAKS